MTEIFLRIDTAAAKYVVTRLSAQSGIAVRCIYKARLPGSRSTGT
jgi:hypothetical protein